MKLKGKEKVSSQEKSKRKMTNSPTEGAPKKKLLATAIQAAKRVEVQYVIFVGDSIRLRLFINFCWPYFFLQVNELVAFEHAEEAYAFSF